MLDDPDARWTLRRALDPGPPEVRLGSLLSLARLQDRDGLVWLIGHPESLENTAPSVALAILKRFGPGFSTELLGVLDRPRPVGRLAIAAAEVLGAWQAPRAREALEHLLGSGGLEERVAAARALGNFGAPESTTSLVTALDDPAWQVRAQAARSLGRIPGAGGVPALRKATCDSSWWVRRNACYALLGHDEEGLSTLRHISRSETDRYAKEMAIEALQALEWEHASPGGMGRVG
jgi:hypothetical protein